MDDEDAVSFGGGKYSYVGDLHTDMNKRERVRFEKDLLAGSRMFEMAATALRDEEDQALASIMSLINVMLMTAYQDLQGIILEAAQKQNRIAEEVAKVKIPDTVEGAE